MIADWQSSLWELFWLLPYSIFSIDENLVVHFKFHVVKAELRNSCNYDSKMTSDKKKKLQNGNLIILLQLHFCWIYCLMIIQLIVKQKF